MNSKRDKMTRTTINTAQARELATAFVSDISEYIRAHEAEYLAYLERTGQVDDSYQPISTEAADSTVCIGEQNGK